MSHLLSSLYCQYSTWHVTHSLILEPTYLTKMGEVQEVIALNLMQPGLSHIWAQRDLTNEPQQNVRKLITPVLARNVTNSDSGKYGRVEKSACDIFYRPNFLILPAAVMVDRGQRNEAAHLADDFHVFCWRVAVWGNPGTFPGFTRPPFTTQTSFTCMPVPEWRAWRSRWGGVVPVPIFKQRAHDLHYQA